MCDYSLMALSNRLAVEGEELVTHRFQRGATGMVSCSDLSNWQKRQERTTFRRIVHGFLPEDDPAPVVCIPPGARLRVTEIPQALQEQHQLGTCEDATFTQLSAEAYRSRDALRFDNGATVRLQYLPEGLKAKVLQLSLSEHVEHAPEQQEMVRRWS